MIDKEQLLEIMNKDDYQPMKRDELVARIGIGQKDLAPFIEILSDGERHGELVVTKKKRYALPKHMGLILATIQGHPRGFGFAIPLDPDEKALGDLFIAPPHLRGAMDQDHVLVEEFKKSKKDKREGRVERVVIRENRTLIGTYQKSKNFGFLVPDNVAIGKDIYISGSKSLGALTGQKVVGKITKWPEADKAAEGEIIEILGYEGDPGVDILSIIKAHDLPVEFPENVLAEANAIAQSIEGEDPKGRVDLRGLRMVTIDGEDARDIDDAISLERDGSGRYLLGVHIADVSHYVKRGSALEKEALKRSTSVYFPDRVLPMLPIPLSNGICSLNAHEDRFSMSCQMVIDKTGKVISTDIGPSIIRVDERLNYREVTEVIEGPGQDVPKHLKSYVEMLQGLADLKDILRKKRMKRGAIDFDFPEVKVIMNDDGSVRDLQKQDRMVSESIIEECMLLANETVAEHLYWLKMPAIYRIHEEPSLEKIDRLNNILARYDLKVEKNAEEIHPRVYAKILNKIKGEPYEEELSMMMLRSMMHARYLEEPMGHFGLASKYYLHFTAPIRRYPDIFVHRAIRASLAGKLSDKQRETMEREASLAAARASERELVAEVAEREAVSLKVVEFMATKVGEIFEATISGIIGSGFFVRLDNLAEGMVKTMTLQDDDYEYIEDQGRLVGARTHKVYKIGDPVRVQLVRADKALKQLDFELRMEKSRQLPTT